jgi:putative transposase
MSGAVAEARQASPAFGGNLLVDETRKRVLGVRYQHTALGSLLKVLPRRRFVGIVERHKGDKHIKGFASWDHLVALVFAQLGGLSSLREIEAVWNAQARHHKPPGEWRDSPLDLVGHHRRRPSAIFAEAFAGLAELAGARCRATATRLLRLIDATPIPLASLHQWAEWNGRTRV